MRFNICMSALLLFAGCCGAPIKPIESVSKNYTTVKQLQEAVNAQAVDETKAPVRVVFSADWCSSCAKLKRLLKQAGIVDKILFANVDDTWAFLLSRDFGVEGLPTLVTIDGGKPSEPRFGVNKITVYLIANVDGDRSE